MFTHASKLAVHLQTVQRHGAGKDVCAYHCNMSLVVFPWLEYVHRHAEHNVLTDWTSGDYSCCLHHLATPHHTVCLVPVYTRRARLHVSLGGCMQGHASSM